MRIATPQPNYYFVDEAGDPIFYNKKGDLIVGQEGCSKLLIIGHIRTTDPVKIRQALANVRKEIANDKYLRKIPSVEKSLNYFHAKDDCPEVRYLVYKTLSKLKFKTEFIVARKEEDRFKKIHQGKENIFYNDMVTRLFESRMRVSQISKLYFAVRGNKVRQAPLSDAIQSSKLAFESKNDTKVNALIDVLPQTMTGEPCLQVADYMLWALQRAYNKRETRYLDYVSNKISFVWDIYDPKPKKKLSRYHSRNKFDINKTSPL